MAIFNLIIRPSPVICGDGQPCKKLAVLPVNDACVSLAPHGSRPAVPAQTFEITLQKSRFDGRIKSDFCSVYCREELSR